jgi:uncharacterized membrane protein
MSWIGWALLSALFAAATALLAKVGVTGIDSNLATAVRTTVVLVFTWGIALALGKQHELRTLDRRAVLFLVLSGLATGLSWLCYFRALQLGQASRVAGDYLRMAAARRKAHPNLDPRWPADHRRRHRHRSRLVFLVLRPSRPGKSRFRSLYPSC